MVGNASTKEKAKERRTKEKERKINKTKRRYERKTINENKSRPDKGVEKEKDEGKGGERRPGSVKEKAK